MPAAALRAASAALLAALLARAQTVPATTVTLDTRACQGGFAALPFCNQALTLDARVRDLVSRIEDADVAPQLTARHGGGDSPGPASNISSLGLPEWDWGLNAIHGVQSSCVSDGNGKTICPTSFMNPVNFGATFNRSLFFSLGAVIATETRALWLAGAVEDSDWSGRPHIGLDVWSPNINIARDPRWGRNCEVCSEEPMVNGLFGQLYTQGVQGGEDAGHLKTIVTLKHWDAYSLEDSDGFTRNNFNAVVSNFALQDTFWPAFRASVVDGGAKGVMCSYNAVNGKPTCANDFLASVLRGTWGFTGYITSDTDAVENVWQPFPRGHQYVNTTAEGACVAIRNGTTDVCSGSSYHDGLMDAVAQGLCSRADVDAALYRTMMVRMQLGLFDAPDPVTNPYWSVPLTAVDTQDSQDLNLLATLSSMVLLKHDGATLPFAKGRSIAVIGPHANASAALVGNYLGQLCADNTLNCVVSPFLALQAANAGGSVSMAAGCAINSTDRSGFAAAVALAQSADFVVLALGIDGNVEGEGHDRVSIDLPQIQHDLAAAIAAVGKPTAVVLVHGGSIDVSAERDNAAIGAIVDSFYAGTRGAEAIAATLLGDNDHCCGKMAFTTYFANYTSQIKMSEMELDVGVGRGYRYFEGPVVFPFAHGLALTAFTVQPAAGFGLPAGVAAAADNAGELAPQRLRAETAASRVLSYDVNVTNVGAVAGDEVVFLFLEPASTPAQPQSRLVRKLLDFQRVHLLPGASQVVSFSASSASLRLVDRATGDVVSTPGAFDLVVTNGVREAARRRVVVEGDEVVVERFPQAAVA